MTDALVTAGKLVQAGAVQLRPREPFTWASGWKSPIYCDNRRLLSQPYIRDFIKSELCNLVFAQYSDAELIAGVSTAGIAWGALVADQLKLPFVYVRPKPKEHGMGNQVEGSFKPHQRTVVLEDLVSTGKSSLQVVDVLRQQGLEVAGMIAIFTYEFQQAITAFEQASVHLDTLTNYSSLLALSGQKGLISGSEEEVLLKWRSDPANWTGLS